MNWQSLMAWLVSISAEPAAVECEHPRAAAAVMVASASLASDSLPTPPEPSPTPDDTKCCDACKGTGWVTMPDGHKVPCPCPETCACKKSMRSQ